MSTTMSLTGNDVRPGPPSALKRLRLGAYVSPNFPSTFFEGILTYLHRKLSLSYTTLVYESSEHNTYHQLAQHEVDLAWVSYHTYHSLVHQHKTARLLPVSIVSQHAKYSPGEDSFGRFADVVIHSSLKNKIKDFYDLRGYRWAYTSPRSYSGHGLTVDRLKSMGENINFFGNYLQSPSQLDSLYLILNGKCDASAVDSSMLHIFLQQHPFFKDQLHVFTSWGELPPFPIVIDGACTPATEGLISSELLAMHNDPEGQLLLHKYGFIKFQPNRESYYYSILLDEGDEETSGKVTANKNGHQHSSDNGKLRVAKDRLQPPYY